MVHRQLLAQEFLDSLKCEEMDERANDWISPWPEMFLMFLFIRILFIRNKIVTWYIKYGRFSVHLYAVYACVPPQMYTLKECIQIAYYWSLTKLSCQKLCFNSRLASCSVWTEKDMTHNLDGLNRLLLLWSCRIIEYPEMEVSHKDN